ncbi:MAG: NAD(P)-binding domain-containing protein [Planctomycetaceae bacterium]
MTLESKRKSETHIAIVGAGPVGLEAAIHFANAGYAVDVYERGTVAQNVQDWGHVRLFSPFGMNVSKLGREAVASVRGIIQLPSDDALLTGREFAERYLLPISRSELLRDCIHEHCDVLAIGRTSLGKTDRIGNPSRANSRFRILICDSQGERNVTADFVLDCSGTYPNHRWVGAGGIPCVGERDVLQQCDYQLPDISGKEREQFLGKKTLVIGSGYSAATAIVALGNLARENGDTNIIWLTRGQGDVPIQPISNDSLSEREQLTLCANRLATDPDSPIHWHPEKIIARMGFDSQSQKYIVELTSGGELQTNGEQGEQREEIRVDRVITNVGYRPDWSLVEELQFHECYATQGPIKLAAALLGETSADCLTQSGQGPEVLRNPEPNFFVLGSKSYGRDSRFLMRIGIEQVQEILAAIDSSAY